eukprot:SAG11_NODE_4505_length_1870_cov_35.487860_5_plen_42_part_01
MQGMHGSATFTYPIKKAALKKIRGHENLHKIVTTTEIKKIQR